MEFSELMESVGEWESESEAAEARGRGGPRRPSTQPSFRPRPPAGAPQYVTQAQLEAALARSDAKIKTVADGVSAISTRVHAVSSAARKEADDRKKAVDTQGKDLNQKMQLMAMLPILMAPKTIEVLDKDGVTADTVLAADDSSLNKLLPLLLISGMGGIGGVSASGDGAGDNNSMMMLAMVMALAK